MGSVNVLTVLIYKECPGPSNYSKQGVALAVIVKLEYFLKSFSTYIQLQEFLTWLTDSAASYY